MNTHSIPTPDSPETEQSLARVVADRELWYHTLELPGGVVTPGWFDLRRIRDRMPWPDVRGKRCLDVGTYDGFFAFELERRGAAEVVAVDIGDHTEWDWPVHLREQGPDRLREMAGEDKTGGFRIAHKALGSQVDHRIISVYDLSPEDVGTFDVVTCGALMLHLRDPLRAMQAIRGVCSGVFMSAEQIALKLTLQHPRFPAVALDGVSDLSQWFVPNVAGHRRMVESAGFTVVETTRPYPVGFGAGHPKPKRNLQWIQRRIGRGLAMGGYGVPYAALLARV